MLKVIYLVFLLVVLTGAKYDIHEMLSDIASNDLSSQGYTWLDEPLFIPNRFKRDANKPKINKTVSGNNCCKGLDTRPNDARMLEDLKRNCTAQYGSRSFDSARLAKAGGDRRDNNDLACVAECVAKGLHVDTAIGKLNHDTVLDLAKRLVGDKYWKDTSFHEYVKNCLHLVEDHKSKVSLKCNSVYLQFYFCVWDANAVFCPEHMRNRSTYCQKIIQRFEKFVLSQPMKPFRITFYNRF